MLKGEYRYICIHIYTKFSYVWSFLKRILKDPYKSYEVMKLIMIAVYLSFS